uniref:Inhibitor I9 domain-containing protein n=1 Tax=Salix viminalis TaxID=40686 RepID=A0A6N2LJT5_SALVM
MDFVILASDGLWKMTFQTRFEECKSFNLFSFGRKREKKLVYLFDIQARGEGVALLLSSERMAESVPSMADSSAAASIQIVYTKRPQDKEPEAYHIRTLASVLGSEDAAKEALLYNYNTVASGFSAKLTPQQAEQISTHRGVRWLASYGKHLLS